MMKAQEKFWKVTSELDDRIFDGELTCKQACEVCPYHKTCKTDELFWGCGVWERSMGDDL